MSEFIEVTRKLSDGETQKILVNANRIVIMSENRDHGATLELEEGLTVRTMEKLEDVKHWIQF